MYKKLFKYLEKKFNSAKSYIHKFTYSTNCFMSLQRSFSVRVSDFNFCCNSSLETYWDSTPAELLRFTTLENITSLCQSNINF